MKRKNTIQLAQITSMAFQKFNNIDFLTYDVQVKGQIFVSLRQKYNYTLLSKQIH